MQVEKTPLKDCFLLKPRVFSDDRGSFFESFNEEVFQKETGLKVNFIRWKLLILPHLVFGHFQK